MSWLGTTRDEVVGFSFPGTASFVPAGTAFVAAGVIGPTSDAARALVVRRYAAAKVRNGGDRQRTTAVDVGCPPAFNVNRETQEATMSSLPADPVPEKALPRALAERLSQRLANFKLGDAVIDRIVDRVLINGLSIIRFNPCIYGVCIDYHTDKPPRLDVLSAAHGIAKWEVFPYGIIDWDRFHVRIAFNVDELEGKGLRRDFDR